MKVLGLIVHVLSIIVAGSIGAMLRGKLRIGYQDILQQVVGIGVLLIGFAGAFDSFFVLQDGQIETTGTLLVLFSLIVGTVFGEAFDVEKALTRLGGCFRRIGEKESAKEAARAQHKKQAPPSDKLPTAPSPYRFEDGFVIASVICAVSAMGFVGAVNAGMEGETTTLFIKAALDAAVVLVLAMLYGPGVPFAALPVLLVEGIVILVAVLKGDLLTPTLVDQIALIAAVITMAAGIHLSFGKRLRVANMIPAALIPVLYGLILLITEKLVDK